MQEQTLDSQAGVLKPQKAHRFFPRVAGIISGFVAAAFTGKIFRDISLNDFIRCGLNYAIPPKAETVYDKRVWGEIKKTIEKYEKIGPANEFSALEKKWVENHGLYRGTTINLNERFKKLSTDARHESTARALIARDPSIAPLAARAASGEKIAAEELQKETKRIYELVRELSEEEARKLYINDSIYKAAYFKAKNEFVSSVDKAKEVFFPEARRTIFTSGTYVDHYVGIVWHKIRGALKIAKELKEGKDFKTILRLYTDAEGKLQLPQELPHELTLPEAQVFLDLARNGIAPSTIPIADWEKANEKFEAARKEVIGELRAEVKPLRLYEHSNPGKYERDTFNAGNGFWHKYQNTKEEFFFPEIRKEMQLGFRHSQHKGRIFLASAVALGAVGFGAYKLTDKLMNHKNKAKTHAEAALNSGSSTTEPSTSASR